MSSYKEGRPMCGRCGMRVIWQEQHDLHCKDEATKRIEKAQGKVRFRLSPNLADGDRWSVVDTPSQVAEIVRMACETLKDEPGHQFLIDTVRMTDEEVEDLIDL